MIMVRIIVTNRKKPAVWGSTATEIFSIRQRVCLLQYKSTIDPKGHLLGEPCTTGVHQEAGQQCETPRKRRKTATLWSNAAILHNIKLSSRPTCNNTQMFYHLLKSPRCWHPILLVFFIICWYQGAFVVNGSAGVGG